jgi:two-component system, NarL family, invasion response regulator UvrY
MQTKLMIADDHDIVRSGLERLLTAQPQYNIIASVGDAKSLMEQCQQQLPELVITDLSMPGMGGIELVRRLKLKWPKLKIVIFSIYQNPHLVRRVLEMGVNGYISKSSATKVILTGIESVLDGLDFISPDINININLAQPLSKLSAREFDIFYCIANGLTTKQISEKLFLSEKTIANNISLIKKKLCIISSTEMMHIALTEGLFFSDQPAINN